MVIVLQAPSGDAGGSCVVPDEPNTRVLLDSYAWPTLMPSWTLVGMVSFICLHDMNEMEHLYMLDKRPAQQVIAVSHCHCYECSYTHRSSNIYHAIIMIPVSVVENQEP